MWFAGIISFISFVLFAFVAIWNQGGHRENEARANVEVQSYRTFMQTADMYFKVTPAPAAKTRYTWNQIAEQAPIPYANARISSTWFVVRMPDGEWAACTDLTEEASSKLGEMFPAPEAGLIAKKLSPGMALGLTDEEAQAAANICL